MLVFFMFEGIKASSDHATNFLLVLLKCILATIELHSQNPLAFTVSI